MNIRELAPGRMYVGGSSYEVRFLQSIVGDVATYKLHNSSDERRMETPLHDFANWAEYEYIRAVTSQISSDKRETGNRHPAQVIVKGKGRGKRSTNA